MVKNSLRQRGTLWIILAVFAVPETGLAVRGDRWDELKLVCGLLRVPEIDAFVEKAHAWQKLESEAQGALHILATNTCPAYLANPNAVESVGTTSPGGVVTLPRYVEEQTRTFSEALTSDSQGQAYQKFLSSRFKAMYFDLFRYRYRFDKSACGQLLMERFKFIESELGKVRSQTVGVKTSCTALAGKVKTPPFPLAGTGRAQGEGAPGERRSPAASSDISGTEDASAKARRGQNPI